MLNITNTKENENNNELILFHRSHCLKFSWLIIWDLENNVGKWYFSTLQMGVNIGTPSLKSNLIWSLSLSLLKILFIWERKRAWGERWGREGGTSRLPAEQGAGLTQLARPGGRIWTWVDTEVLRDGCSVTLVYSEGQWAWKTLGSRFLNLSSIDLLNWVILYWLWGPSCAS